MTLRSQVHLHDLLCFALYSTSRAMTELFREYLDEADLTYPQFLVLFLLWAEDGCPIGTIGDTLTLEGGTVTPLLKRMEQKGLIERRRGHDDERVVRVHLTRRGRALETTLLPTVAEGTRCDLGMSPKQIASMAAQLHTVRATIETAIAQRGQRSANSGDERRPAAGRRDAEPRARSRGSRHRREGG